MSYVISSSGFRDHPYFDKPSGTKPQHKKAKIMAPEYGAAGAQGVRSFHRRNDENILYHKRAMADID